QRLVFTIPVVCLFLYLSQTLIFAKTTSVYYPWDRNLLLSNQLKEPENIEMLKGKLYDEETRNYYQIIAQTMTNYSNSCKLEYLVNLQWDSYILFLTKSFKKVQRSPLYGELFENVIFQDEKEKIAEILRQKKAILVASDKKNIFKKIPKNYEIILEVSAPKSIPWISRRTYIAVPKNLNCQN
ncbi:MAG: hypothetical protein ACKPBT_13955, partial [Microcystis aeruginosa]